MAWSKNLDWSVFYQIPDGLRECYLAKLGIEIQSPSRDYLDNLVKAHQCTIPFENLAVTLWNEPVSIEPHKLMDKLLHKGRGGYCFELNGLFHLLLRSLDLTHGCVRADSFVIANLVLSRQHTVRYWSI